jgi:hypothetical protein
MAQSDLDGLKGILMGLGLTQMPRLIQSLHKAKHMGNMVERGHTPDGSHADAQAIQSVLAPLLQMMQAGQQGPAQGGGQAQPEPAPPSGPGMRVGAAPPSMPAMPALPRTLNAAAGMGGI